MKKLMMLVAAVGMMFGMSAGAQDISGDWQGTLHAEKDLRIVIKITKDDGKLKVVGYSIDQGANAMNATGATLDGTDFKFAVPGVGGTYSGKLTADGNTINGTWTPPSWVFCLYRFSGVLPAMAQPSG